MQTLKRTCAITRKEFEILPQEQEVLRRIGELNPAVGEAFPLPTVHPLEQVRQFLTFGNTYYVYMGKSDLSGSPTISRFHPTLGLRICTPEEFYSDAVDNTAFGMEYDFSRPFFQQWQELLHRAYLMPSNSLNAENSSYVNGVLNVKDCFLVFAGINLENCMYCEGLFGGNDCVDCIRSTSLRYCYSCVSCDNCYECQHCTDTKGSSNCFGCFDCTSCESCFGCVGLTHQKYCVFNEQKTKEEYETFIQKLQLHDFEARAQALRKCASFITDQHHSANRIVNCENSTGIYLYNSVNSIACFNSSGLENCGYVTEGFGKNKDCWKGWVADSELSYLSGSINASNAFATYSTESSYNSVYSYFLYQNCRDCFGCVSLRQKSYCILNKQYTKEEYMALVPRIIAHMKSTGEWGQFFPPSMAPHYYEETVANEWFEALPSSELQRRGYRSGLPKEAGSTAQALQTSDLPSIYTEGVEQLVGKALLCPQSAQVFSIQAREMAFYKRYGIPLPRVHWKVRFKELFSQREKIPAVL